MKGGMQFAGQQAKPRNQTLPTYLQQLPDAGIPLLKKLVKHLTSMRHDQKKCSRVRQTREHSPFKKISTDSQIIA